MSFFKDLLKKQQVQEFLGEAAESVFGELIDILKKLAESTETDADNIALKALLQAAVDELNEAGVPDAPAPEPTTGG